VSSNHFLAASASRGELFCFLCGDYVYDLEFELARKVCPADLRAYTPTSRISVLHACSM
jgi:hypothetical protein